MPKHIFIAQLSTPYTACAEITCDQGKMVVASCYMRHSMPKHIFIAQLSTPYTACAEITCDQGRMVVASCYMRYSMPKDILPAQLEVIVGMDANSKSTLWGSPRAYRNGRLMEEFIAAQSLAVLKDGEQGPTIQKANGSFYIDVTLVTERTSGKINSWRH